MREVTKFVGLVVLMVGARYAPLERTGEAINWLVRSKAPATPALVTGSVAKAEEKAPEASSPHVAALKRHNVDDAVKTILAEANSEVRPNTRQNSNNNGDGGRSRVRRDEGVADEIFTGGTGLLDDDDGDSDKVHPLASANPDDYLVICEAGCRPKSDRIVYRVSKLAAASAAIAQRRLETTAAEPGKTQEESNEVVCVAGCYDEPAPSRRRAGTQQDVRKFAKADTSGGQAKSEAAPIHTASITRDEKPAAAKILNASPSVLEVAAAKPPAALQLDVVTVTVSNVTAANTDSVASAHLISAETQAHLAAKQSKLAMAATPAKPAAQQSWSTTVKSVVALPKPEARRRSVVALNTPPKAVSPFETSISVENGWDWTLANNP